MTTTAAKIAQLEDALGSGALTIESDGERVTYRSREDLIGALDYFKAKEEAEAQPTGAARVASTVAVFCRD